VGKVGARQNALLSVVLPTASHGNRCTQCNSDPDTDSDADPDVVKSDPECYPDSCAKGNTYSNEECLPVLFFLLVFHVRTFAKVLIV
jgi:hypothetical protein